MAIYAKWIFSHLYQLDEFISNFRVVGWYFSILLNVKYSSAKHHANGDTSMVTEIVNLSPII